VPRQSLGALLPGIPSEAEGIEVPRAHGELKGNRRAGQVFWLKESMGLIKGDGTIIEGLYLHPFGLG
jgi:hypothetical protein